MLLRVTDARQAATRCDSVTAVRMALNVDRLLRSVTVVRSLLSVTVVRLLLNVTVVRQKTT